MLESKVIIQLNRILDGKNKFDIELSLDKLEFLSDEFYKLSQSILIHLEIYRYKNQLTINGTVSTSIITKCSRCAIQMTVNLKEDFKLYSLLTSKEENIEPNNWEEDLLILSNNAEILVLDDTIREILLLAIPMQPLCKSDCKGLCTICGVDLNYETCKCTKSIDNRWQKLADLKPE